MTATPTARSLALLRDHGWLAEKVEQRLPIPGQFVTRDAFGFGDILAVRFGTGGSAIALVQATSSSNLSARVKKATTGPVADGLRTWLSAGGKFLLFGWGKRGPRGSRKTWTCRVAEVWLDDDSPNEFEIREDVAL